MNERRFGAEPTDERGSDTLTPKEKQFYMDMFWEKAEKLGEIRQRLEKRMAEVKSKMAEDRTGLNTYEIELDQEMEGEFWELQRRVWAIEQKEQDVENLLHAIENDKVYASALFEAYPLSEQGEEEKLSSRRRAMLEQEMKFGISQQEVDDYLSWEYGGYWYGVQNFGSNPTNLTTGRNLKRLKSEGKLGQLEAADEFFWRTADTHGGKVKKPGKKARGYRSKSGKVIRKS